MALFDRIRNALGVVPGEERLRWWPGLLALLVPLGIWLGSACVGAAELEGALPAETAGTDPVAELNRQIEKFNATRQPDQGTFPIKQRVARVEYDSKEDTATCLDQQGNAFLTLKRGEGGRFRGRIQVEVRETVLPSADRRWGHATVEFLLLRETVLPSSKAASESSSGRREQRSLERTSGSMGTTRSGK